MTNDNLPPILEIRNFERAALEQAALGFASFPVWWIGADGKCACGVDHLDGKNSAKHPLTPRGLHDASTDPVLIARWGAIAPSANIGVAVPDGIIVVDCDPRNGGEETLQALWKEHGRFPETRTVLTGGDGAHFYFRGPVGHAYPSTLNGLGKGTGIDIKQQGGYVLAPPSNHASGKTYRWASAPDAPIADAPAWILALGWVRGERSAVTITEDDGERAVSDEQVTSVVASIEPHYRDGSKHNMAKAFGGWACQRGWSQSDVRAVIEALPSKDPRGRVKAALAAFGIDHSYGAEELRGFLGGAENLDALDAIAPNPKRETEKAELAGLVEAMTNGAVTQPLPRPANDAQAHAPPPAAAQYTQPYILQSATHAESILLWRGADRGHRPVALGSLRTVIRDTGLAEQIPLYSFSVDPEGKEKRTKLSPGAIVEQHGKSYEHTAYDFALRVSTYDPARSLVTVGYPNASPAAAYDPDVDAWLRALAGDAYPRLAVWIASCAQRHIRRLAAALVLIGSADVGKSLFSCAAAGLWGAATPPAAALLIKQFNGELKNCAVICDEEAQLFGSKQLSTKRFRDLTQSTERSIELKGLETFTLRGALRVIVPCNEVSDLRFTDLGGPDIVNAVIDRLCVIDCKPREQDCKAALKRLRLPGGWVCDRDRVIAHLAWLTETVELPAERFLGAGAGAESVLAGHVRDTADVWEGLLAWIDADGDGPTPFWCAKAGKGLCVDPAVMARGLATVGRGWDLRGVRAALEPFKLVEYHPRGEARLWVLDADRLGAALRLDAERVTRLAYKLSAAEAPAVRLVDGRFGKTGGAHQ